jgi:hypothetical protein
VRPMAMQVVSRCSLHLPSSRLQSAACMLCVWSVSSTDYMSAQPVAGRHVAPELYIQSLL